MKQSKLFDELKLLRDELLQFLEKNNQSSPNNNADDKLEINSQSFTGFDKLNLESEKREYASFSKVNLENSFTCVSEKIPINEQNNEPVDLTQNNPHQNDQVDLLPLHKILSSFNSKNKDILFLVDGSKRIWEIVKRPDLNIQKIEAFKHQEILSINDINSDFYIAPVYPNNKAENLINVSNAVDDYDYEIIKSLNNSDISIGKMSEMESMMNMVKETLNDMSDLY